MRHLFGVRVRKYVEKLVSKTKPSKILVCMIYYPDESRSAMGSWADPALGAMGYDRDPSKLQALIRKVRASSLLFAREKSKQILLWAFLVTPEQISDH